jgi:Na+/H+ antiporter NhaD/arsenite permease-like protein
MWFALALFVLTYIMLLILPKVRALTAFCSAVLFVVSGIMPASKVFSAVDWNALLMIAGTMGIVSLFIESKMPLFLADLIIDKMPDVRWVIIMLSLFAGLISAFVDNVATVLMVAPVAVVVAKKLETSPVPFVISIAISSNLQGAATLVGDTTSILLGDYAGLDFTDFFFYHGRIGMFWVVQVGALVSAVVLLILFRKQRQKVALNERSVVQDFVPTILLVGMIVLLIFASFLKNKPSATNGLICIGVLLLGLIRQMIRTKAIQSSLVRITKEIDWTTLVLLMSLLIVIAGISEAGVVDAISRLFVQFSGGNLFAVYTLLVFASVLLSAFIDNIPYVATMLPVTAATASLMGVDPTILYFGLLCGATLGGNLTPIGASANITALGILQRNGYPVRAKEFMKISVPFTIVAVLSGYLLIWLIWS